MRIIVSVQCACTVIGLTLWLLLCALKNNMYTDFALLCNNEPTKRVRTDSISSEQLNYPWKNGVCSVSSNGIDLPVVVGGGGNSLEPMQTLCVSLDLFEHSSKKRPNCFTATTSAAAAAFISYSSSEWIVQCNCQPV